MSAKFVSIALAVAATVSVLACRTTPSPLASCEYPQNTVTREDALPENTAGLLGSALRDQRTIHGLRAGTVAVHSSSSVRTSTGTLQVLVTLRNCSGSTLALEARAHFLGETGEPIEAPGEWHRVFLAGDSIASFTEFSVSTDRVANYYVEVREARQS